jgi:hypothetical protein
MEYEPLTFDRTSGRIGTSKGTIAKLAEQDGRGRAYGGFPREALESYATLMAAAPALLEACQAVVASFNAGEDERLNGLMAASIALKLQVAIELAAGEPANA